MQAVNNLRETFPEADKIRFHPIITKGGDAVNAIPDRVVVESYLRASSLKALFRENPKVNRAFAGAAAAMGCKLVIKDLHGYAPRFNDLGMRKVFEEAALSFLPAENVKISENWGTGCSDMGDVNCVMPGIHPYAGGGKGSAHSSTYFIEDPYYACVISAKMQVGMTAVLLQDDAARAKDVLAKGRQDYPTIREYLDSIDKLSLSGDTVTYQEDGTVTLKYKN
jgi:metal-dependent amidase/aminoacylase/carboxypeptidase family protein